MEADKCIRDVVRSTETEYQSRRCFLQESADNVDREANQCASFPFYNVTYTHRKELRAI